MTKVHSLNLLTNSISFFQEAVAYAIRKQEDQAHWKFAVINLVQSMELALKESLQRIHPAFIFDDVDCPNPYKTVSITKAIDRLRNKQIGNMDIDDDEVNRFRATIKLRNQLVHHECRYTPEFAEAKFGDIFAFMIFFYASHMGVAREDVLTDDDYFEVLVLKKTREQLLTKARAYIESNDVGDVWSCPECQEDTFIVMEEKCKLCGCSGGIVICPRCENSSWDEEMEDITQYFESDYSEGRTYILNRYGYDYNSVCRECVSEVKSDIREKVQSERYEELEAEHFERMRRW